MLTLENLFGLMVLLTLGSWLWHNHGLRERALERVKQHCAKLDLELLDDTIALRRIGFIPDARGRRRLGRVYDFEFTVTGEQRHSGTATQFGAHALHIELAPYPFQAEASAPVDNVIEMQQWRRTHDRWNP